MPKSHKVSVKEVSVIWSFNSAQNHWAIGIPNPFLRRLIIALGKIPAKAFLKIYFVVRFFIFRRPLNAAVYFIKSRSKNGERTSKEFAMLARSVFVKISS